MGYLKILNVLWLVVLLSGASVAQAAPDPREMQAREAFGAGRYQDALDLFAKLYAENLNPVFLRNIGRCYQNLSEPDRAISSFHEYIGNSQVSARPVVIVCLQISRGLYVLSRSVLTNRR
jgi:tetratricopeptide (TPR) repeat protein